MTAALLKACCLCLSCATLFMLTINLIAIAQTPSALKDVRKYAATSVTLATPSVND